MKKLLVSLISFSTLAFIPNSFSTKFTQETISQLNKQKRQAIGIFEYQYPSNLKVKQSAPDELIYVTNSRTTWIYEPPFLDDEPGVVKIYKGQESGLSSFFDILKSGLKSNKNYSVKKSKKEAVLNFKKIAQKKTGVKQAILTFNKKKIFKSLNSIVITYEDKRVVTLKLSKIVLKPKFKDDHFIFKIPKGSRVSNQ